MASELTKHKLLKLLNTAIPQADRIIEVDENATPDSIAFNWRGLDFYVTTRLEVSESGLRATTCHSLLMQALLRETHANH